MYSDACGIIYTRDVPSDQINLLATALESNVEFIPDPAAREVIDESYIAIRLNPPHVRIAENVDIVRQSRLIPQTATSTRIPQTLDRAARCFGTAHNHRKQRRWACPGCMPTRAAISPATFPRLDDQAYDMTDSPRSAARTPEVSIP